MPTDEAYAYCPHVVASTGFLCGLSDVGRGRRTRIPIPFVYLDGEPFVVTCPACENEVMVDTPCAQDGPDAPKEEVA